MRIEFDDEGNVIYDDGGRNNYIEANETKEGIEIVLSSKDPENHRQNIHSTIKLSKDDFRKLISDINI